MAFLNALFTAALDNNLVFAQVIGMVSVVVAAGRPQASLRFGAMVCGAVAVSGALGWPIYTLVMRPWGIEYLAPLAYVLVSWVAVVAIATALGAKKPVAEREHLLSLCPIAACNACVLAVPLGNAALADTMGWDAALGSSLGAGLGVFLAIVLFASVYRRIDQRLVPRSLRGLPIMLVTASLMALAFTGVAGIAGGLFA